MFELIEDDRLGHDTFMPAAGSFPRSRSSLCRHGQNGNIAPVPPRAQIFFAMVMCVFAALRCEQDHVEAFVVSAQVRTRHPAGRRRVSHLIDEPARPECYRIIIDHERSTPFRHYGGYNGFGAISGARAPSSTTKMRRRSPALHADRPPGTATVCDRKARPALQAAASRDSIREGWNNQRDRARDTGTVGSAGAAPVPASGVDLDKTRSGEFQRIVASEIDQVWQSTWSASA